MKAREKDINGWKTSGVNGVQQETSGRINMDEGRDWNGEKGLKQVGGSTR